MAQLCTLMMMANHTMRLNISGAYSSLLKVRIYGDAGLRTSPSLHDMYINMSHLYTELSLASATLTRLRRAHI
eukprot:2153361-Amphidinium_carterae.1